MGNASEHKANDFTPVVGALRLAEHVIKITDNPNKFPEYSERRMKNPDGTVTMMFVQRNDGLVNRVRDQAWEIYLLCYTANKINVNREPERRHERLEKQLRAISLIDEHLAAVQLCREHFHLPVKRVRHWGQLALDLQSAIKGWHESDRRRYGL